MFIMFRCGRLLMWGRHNLWHGVGFSHGCCSFGSRRCSRKISEIAREFACRRYFCRTRWLSTFFARLHSHLRSLAAGFVFTVRTTPRDPELRLRSKIHGREDRGHAYAHKNQQPGCNTDKVLTHSEKVYAGRTGGPLRFREM